MERTAVQSLVRAFRILEAFPADRSELTLAEIATAVGLSKTTTYRLLNTLISLGCVTRTRGAARYRLGYRLFELGSRFITQLDVRRLALPYLLEIEEKTQDTAFLCIRDNTEALCVERVDGRFQVRVLALQLGGRLPVHCGAAPVALLLGMSDAEITTLLRNHTYTRYTDNTIQTLDDLLSTVHASQARGYVLSWEDVTPGVAAIGAPVRDHTGHVVAAISVAGIIQRFSPERRAFLANTVTGAARSLSQDLGYTGSPPPVQQT